MKFSKTTLLTILLAVFVIAASIFAFQWWQVKGELGKKIEENENLTKQIEKLQKKIEELKTAQIGDETIEERKAEVTITTDKKEYKQGEIVKITVRNGLDKSIWYCDIGRYARPCGSNPWWSVQKFERGTWVKINVYQPVERECLSCLPEDVPIEELMEEVKSNSEIIDKWILENCEETPSGIYQPKLIGPGIHKISFSYGFSKDSWEEKTSYSSEFVIKGD